MEGHVSSSYENNPKLEHNISAQIQLARTSPLGRIIFQGKFGNVFFIWVTCVPSEKP